MQAAEPHWVEYLTAFGAVATPVLVVALGALGWKFRAEYERRIALENQLRDERIKIYNDILEPFIIMFTPEAAWKVDPKNKNKDKFKVGEQKALSLAYRERAFQLALIGSDGVVTAYNNMMQFLFQGADLPVDDARAKALMGYVGELMLEIRKSMGNDDTSLDKWGMLEWFITDARKYRDG